MTLSEFYSKFFPRPTILGPTTLYVFKDEDSADDWVKRKYFGLDHDSYELDMVIQSDMIIEYTVKEEWCKAEVQQFYAVEPDVIVVIAEPQESEDKK